MSLVLLLLKRTNTHFGFINIFFLPSQFGIQYPLSISVEPFEDAIDRRASNCTLSVMVTCLKTKFRIIFFSNFAASTDAW